MLQTIEVSRGAVLTLGFIIGRILHTPSNNMMSSSSAAADVETAAVDRMDVDTNTVVASDSALSTAIRSAVHRLGESSSCRTVRYLQNADTVTKLH